MECTSCGRVKNDREFSTYRGWQRHECKECRATEAREKYAARKRKNLCPLCGEYPSMVGSCMCEGCWFIRNGPRVAWIEQKKKCPYTGTPLVPGHNMKFDGISWVSKWYAVISKGMTREEVVAHIDAAHDRREVRIEPPEEETVVESGVRFFTDEYYQDK